MDKEGSGERMTSSLPATTGQRRKPEIALFRARTHLRFSGRAVQLRPERRKPINHEGRIVMKVVTLKDIPNAPMAGAEPIPGYTGPVSRSRQTII
jgi:hypothetical protein